MSIPNLNEPSADKEEFEGYFSRSALRSGYFVAAAAACVAAIAYNVVVVERHWRVLRTADAQLLIVMAITLVSFLWMSLAQHARVHQLYKDGLISDVKQNTPLYTVLRVAAKTTNHLLFFGSIAAVSLLLVVDQLLSS